jgi:hypothetical protein
LGPPNCTIFYSSKNEIIFWLLGVAKRSSFIGFFKVAGKLWYILNKYEHFCRLRQFYIILLLSPACTQIWVQAFCCLFLFAAWLPTQHRSSTAYLLPPAQEHAV